MKLGNPNVEQAQRLAAQANVEAKEARLAMIQPIIREIVVKGRVNTLKDIAAALDARGISIPRNDQWSITQVRRPVERLVRHFICLPRGTQPTCREALASSV